MGEQGRQEAASDVSQRVEGHHEHLEPGLVRDEREVGLQDQAREADHRAQVDQEDGVRLHPDKFVGPPHIRERAHLALGLHALVHRLVEALSVVGVQQLSDARPVLIGLLKVAVASAIVQGLGQVEDDHVLLDDDEHSVGAHPEEGSVECKEEKGPEEELDPVKQPEAGQSHHPQGDGDHCVERDAQEEGRHVLWREDACKANYAAVQDSHAHPEAHHHCH